MKTNIILLFAAIICLSFTQNSSQLLNTQLQIMVLDENGNVQEDAEVKLYETKEDFENEKYAVEPQLTNKKGKTRFKGLKEQAYYIEVSKGKKDNSLGAEMTSKLTLGKINKINVIIQ